MMACAPDQSHPELTRVGVNALLRRGCWASLAAATIESLTAGGRVIEFPTGHTVYAEADDERLAVLLLGLLRVYMHASDGRQVTVRYVRVGDLLGVPALVGGPAPCSCRRACPAQRSSLMSIASNEWRNILPVSSLRTLRAPAHKP
jgi:CRP-like cAMP-binding protein